MARAPRQRVGVAVACAGPARQPLEHPYYSGGVRYMLWATAPNGAELPLADGGVFDWLGRLTANRRNVFVASGLGAQLVPLVFRAAAPSAGPGHMQYGSLP